MCLKRHVRQQVYFRDRHKVRFEEDAGILQRLLLTFSDAQQHDLVRLAEIVAGRADQVPDVLDHQEVELIQVEYEVLPPVLKAQFESVIPRREMGRPEEIASVALFLASDDSSYVNGMELVVDGGTTVI